MSLFAVDARAIHVDRQRRMERVVTIDVVEMLKAEASAEAATAAGASDGRSVQA